MVKFSKELEAQLIPEWRDAFVNYWQLKKQIKHIKLCIIKPKAKPIHHVVATHFGVSLFDPIRYLGDKISNWLLITNTNTNTNSGVETKQVTQEDDEEEEDDDDDDDDDDDQVVNESDLVHFFSEEDEVKKFFESLDEELAKVNQFYKTKEEEFGERGEMLNKQLHILLDLKQIRKKNNNTKLTSSFSARSSDFSDECSETEQVMTALEKNIGVNLRSKTKNNNNNRTNRRKIEIPATTPVRTISAVTSMLWEDLVTNPKKLGNNNNNNGDLINKKTIQCAEKMIRGAFVELYRGLGLLKTYSSLNMVGFTKILKKFDKVAKQQASSNYLKLVKRSHFMSSDKIVRLMDDVESTFTKQFVDNDRKKAMKFLRPQHQKESHMLTFFLGLFTGSFITLFTLYAILAHLSEIFSPSVGVAYAESVYPVFSMFALLSLHMFMYGCNLFMWKRKRINFNFIFEFSSTTSLKYRDAFLICTAVMTSVVAALVIHLILRSTTILSPAHVDAIPGILLLFFLALLICPFNIFYRSTRYSFIRVIRNIVFSPLYKVMMVDFFMADQLTSQIPLLRHMESTACYFLAGSFRTHQFDTCKSGKLYRELAYVISFLPYYWRAMQCARRWFDECDLNHLANMGKYVSAMVAAGARITYSKQEDHLWLGIVLVTSVFATLYQLYWDFVMDWGFFNPKSRNLWLRDDLVLKKKSIYYFSIALNVLLRVAWVETVLRFKFGFIESRLLEFLLASLEVIRRGHWNFYRLENEHLNNVGKYRAVKTVPLPFRDSDESDG